MGGTVWSPMGKGFNLDSIVEAAEADAEAQSESKSVLPTVSTVEDAEKIVLRLEVPGFREEDLHVQVKGKTLKVHGEVDIRSAQESDGLEQVGRQHGVFVRTLALPKSVDGTGMRTTYEAGVMTIVLPKRAEREQNAVQSAA